MCRSPRTRGSGSCRSPRGLGIQDSFLRVGKRRQPWKPRYARLTANSPSLCFRHYLQPIAWHRLDLELFHGALEAYLERLGAFLKRRAGQRTLDEQRKPADIDERLTRHIHAQQFDRRGAITGGDQDRKSTRLNSSHTVISYAVFCLKKKKKKKKKKSKRKKKIRQQNAKRNTSRACSK